MTKYLDPSFNSPANNKNYDDNYNRVFGINAMCPTCEKVCRVKFTGELEGNREKAICQGCGGEVWLYSGSY